jgi:hypothetical protein
MNDSGRLFIRNIAMCFDNTLAPVGERKRKRENASVLDFDNSTSPCAVRENQFAPAQDELKRANNAVVTQQVSRGDAVSLGVDATHPSHFSHPPFGLLNRCGEEGVATTSKRRGVASTRRSKPVFFCG